MLRSRAVSDRKASDFSAAARPATIGRPAPSCSASKPTLTGATNSKSFNNVGTPFLGAGVPALLSGDFLSVNGKAALSWLGTTRARVGFVATPDNRLMIYATGGVAYGGGTSNFSVFDSTTGSFFTGSPSSTRVGWVIGGGVEYAVTNNITIKGEYLYADLGSSNFTTVGNAAAALNFPGVFASGQPQLQRVDLPRGRELQVLSLALQAELFWPEERRLSSGFFWVCLAVTLWRRRAVSRNRQPSS